jgi:hypothetical protein
MVHEQSPGEVWRGTVINVPTCVAILRYSDGSLCGIDFARQEVIATNMPGQLRRLEALVKYAVSAVPAGRNPYGQGGFFGELRRWTRGEFESRTVLFRDSTKEKPLEVD